MTSTTESKTSCTPVHQTKCIGKFMLESRSRSSASGLLVKASLFLLMVWTTPTANAASSMWRSSSGTSDSTSNKAMKSKNNKDNNRNKVFDKTVADSTVEEPWRARTEWWKDPLALFDENDELIDPLNTAMVATDVTGVTESEVDDDFILPLEEAQLQTSVVVSAKNVYPSDENMQITSATTSANSKASAAGKSQSLAMESNVTPLAEIDIHPVPHQQQSAPLGAILESPVITHHSFEPDSSGVAIVTSPTTIPAIASTTADPMAVLPAVSTTMATTAIPSNYNPYAAGLNVGSLLSNLPAVKILAVLAVGKAIITGINMPPPGIPSTENNWESSSSTGSSSGRKNRRDENDSNNNKSSRRNSASRDSDIAAATAATNSVLLSSSSQGWTNQLTTWFGLRRRSEDDDEKLPSARQLMDEVEVLRKRAETAEQERQVMEREYEKTSWQLQEAQNELSSLTSTTRYLKAQLRDNEEMMDRAIRAERRKAKEELLRLKDAMLEVVERERQAMRDELTRQADEVQSLLRDGVSKNSYPA